MKSSAISAYVLEWLSQTLGIWEAVKEKHYVSSSKLANKGCIWRLGLEEPWDRPQLSQHPKIWDIAVIFNTNYTY